MPFRHSGSGTSLTDPAGGSYNPTMLAIAPLLLAASLSPQRLWDEWPQARFVAAAAPCLRPSDVAEGLHALEARHRGQLTLEEVGRSVEGRPISLLTVGHGPFRVLLWSQMHGDEPSATPALLDVASYLLAHAADPAVARILDRTTLLMIPMLNPDGAERYRRRNAQAIDVNRDALSLATPEGRLLKDVRDRYQPRLGFNLHDENRRTAVGDTARLSTISLLAVAGDPQGTVTPGRKLTKRLCSLLVEVLQPFAAGRIARYDEDWSPRAFGDNLTRWGTPVVLIESGGLPPDRPMTELTRLDFVGILAALDAVATNDVRHRSFDPYERLPRNTEDAWADVVVQGGAILQPGLAEPYRADLAFDVRTTDAARAACPAAAAPPGSRIVEVGDGRFLGAGRAVDATGAVLVPSFAASVEGTAPWLDAAAVDALARLGVGRIEWRAPALERAALELRAMALAGPGRPEVVVVPGEAPTAALPLTGPPGAGDTATMGGLLDALLGPAWRTDAALAHERLMAATARLEPEAPASFLVLRPARDGMDAGARIESVWIGGREVR